MNQRSISAKRNQKTYAQGDLSFEKKISKAIQHKKQIVAKMTSQKVDSNQFLTNRLSSFLKGKEHLYSQQSITPKKTVKIVNCSEKMILQYLDSYQISSGVCIRHPHKKAAFQQKDKRGSIYCHECAINMVKSNAKVIGISPQTLMFKHMLVNQLSKINEEQMKVKQIIDNYYEDLRQKFEHLYSQFIEQKTFNPESISFGMFQSEQKMLSKLNQTLGKIQEIQFRMVTKEQKQNKHQNTNKGQTGNQNLHYGSKNASFDLMLQTNRSIQSKSSRNSCKQTRPRQNSDFYKRQRPDMKKMLKLR